jgi:propanediol dehydratase small subunit
MSVPADLAPARLLWALVEPVHAVTYFAPEARAALRDHGIRRFWDGYFAARAAPLGAASAGTVTATFFGFAPTMVAQSVPGVWQLSTPAQLLEARSAAAGAALERVLRPAVTDDEVDEAATLLDRVGRTGAPAGRPLFAANLDLPAELTPARRLWQAATLLREYRGDGHVALLVGADLDGCAAHVLRAGGSAAEREQLQPNRGWSDEQWAAAETMLTARGWLDEESALTSVGAHRRQHIEDRTDALAAVQLESLSAEELARLSGLLTPMAAALTEVVPYPNPMGAPPPPGARLS